ncbi:MAG TPA: SAM-dependent methyltransferase [Stellaceae bacterium]|nr:SAM-dependent methyltransferase [Stellaceae bacterium]
MAETLTGVSAPLLAHLARRIRAAGPISVAAYMDEALFHPRWGYYATRDPLGAGGDFITAPEVSQMFGELIGLWCAELWRRLGAPGRVTLVELGPGRGTLMRDALRAARLVPGFNDALELHLVERSPVLRAMQADTLAGFAPRWHDDLATVPAGPMLLVANEFLDALPIRQFVRAADCWRERMVALDGDALAFALDPDPATESSLPDAAPGAIRETSHAARAIARAIGARLARDGGAALIIDYGYGPGGLGETLQAVRRHARHDVLDAPGSADLTAHVDFAAIAEAAGSAGARVAGPMPQGAFLRALGIEARAARLLAIASPDQAALIRSACRRLIDPAGMGLLFKVMALAHPAAPALAGFDGEAA